MSGTTSKGSSSFDTTSLVQAKRQKVLCSWSGGKDCALALHELMRSGGYEVAALLTVLTGEYDRISMHGVRASLLEAQARAMGLPLEKVFITKDATNEEYEEKMTEVLTRHMKTGTGAVMFGDIHLEDLRAYRETNLAKVGMKGVFPLWKRDPGEVARAFMEAGFRAVITCVDTNLLDARFVGREYDRALLADLPPSVDPCGENGEFHTFVYAGPLFNAEIPVTGGETVLREERFCFRDLLAT